MIKRRYDSDVIIETIINNKKCFELSYNMMSGSKPQSNFKLVH